MPPREDEASPKSFTWITGNPRSKKNITQIRRHAGQNSGVKTENGSRAHSSSSPRPGQRSSTKLFRPVYPSLRIDETAEHSSGFQSEQPVNFDVNHPSTAAEYAAVVPSIFTHEPVNAPQPVHPFTPSLNGSPLITEDANPTRKLAIWDLVNHSAEEEERHRLEVLATTPRQDSDDDRLDYFSGGRDDAEPKHALSAARSHSPRNPRKPSPPPGTLVLQANVAKRRKAASAAAHSHLSWRVGMPLSHPVSLSKEDSQIEQILLQTSAFYMGKYESSWSARLRESGMTYFDTISAMESFAGSITTAGGLMAVGRVDSASSILSRVLPTLSDLLISQHPQLYYILAELSLDNPVSTALGRLRGQVRRFAASASLTILGASHPVTKLLRLDFPDADTDLRLRLRELIQRRIHDLLEELFAPTSYQTTGHHYYFARVLAQLRHLDEARQIFSQIVTIWEDRYGVNDIMPITGLLELTKVHLSSNDLSKDTESLISDALRRTLTLEKSESEERTPGLVHSRMGCLRTLGRLHVMRGNLETAMMQYTAAVSVGIRELGPSVPAVQLALADLDVVSQMVGVREDEDEEVVMGRLASQEQDRNVDTEMRQKERDREMEAKIDEFEYD